MSTRGAVGIIFNGESKIGYSHYDSYPEGLGASVLEFLKKHDMESLKYIFNEIKLDGDHNEVWNDNKNCFNYSFADNEAFLYDSLFCEYAYIINLDTGNLEFYKGFNTNPKGKGRYVKLGKHVCEPFTIVNSKGEKTKVKKKTYYGVNLKKEIPLENIKEYSIKNNSFVKRRNYEKACK